MSSGIYPEKFAMYFANMNSLSGKIFSDLQAAEDSLPSGLSYSEKCVVLDKFLIQDVLHKKRTTSHKNHSISISNGKVGESIQEKDKPEKFEETLKDCLLGGDDLEQDQIRCLLMSVYPKKPEKYVFEENGVWIDEFSQPFNFCKQSQAKSCHLGDLIRNLPMPIVQKEILNPINPEKSETGDDGNGTVEGDSNFERNKRPKSKSKPKSKPSFFGVNVMGFMGGPECQSQNQQTVMIPMGGTKIEDDVGKEDENEVDESNLPKQKQNLELIAELQAKLKKTGSGGKAGLKHVNKPKAPPPPPPPVNSTKDEDQNIEVPDKSKIQTESGSKKPVELQGSTDLKVQSQKSSPMLKKNTMKDQDFCVDVSSPCRIATPKTGLDFLDNW